MDSVIGVHDTQAQHILGFGTTEDPSHELNPSPGVYNWDTLDPYVQDMIDAGATRPVIIFYACPGWTKPASITTQTFGNEWSVAPARRGDFATLCAAVAARYNGTGGRPFVRDFQFWNEMKGYWIPNQFGAAPEPAQYASYSAAYGTDGGNNRWHYERYVRDYNAAWAAVKAARPDARMGGNGYVILRSTETGSSELTFPGGVMDQRALDVVRYFVNNATGFDWLACDGGIENQQGAPLAAAPYSQIQKLWGFWNWCRTLGGAAATCEFINFETYVQFPGYPIANGGLGWSPSQVEDLFIELCRQTQANVTLPNVTYLTWFHPQFWPQVVNKANDFVWLNSESNFRPKVAQWHAQGQ
jgi:hypothetical protein